MNKNNNVSGKRLLILGSTKATYDLVLTAKAMGVRTLVTDDNPNNITRTIADEEYFVSTTDIEDLRILIREKNVDGVFCGPSEFNIRNLIKVCELEKLPCYATMEQWNRCADKDTFTQYCMENNVDCPKEYSVNEFSSEEELEELDYPVIVKPVDRCSSIGITVCDSKNSIRKACHDAMEASNCKRIIVEKYIENNGELFGVRYFLRDGEAYPYLLIDTYIADPIHKVSLISAVTLAPSKHIDYYMKHMDSNVRKMFKEMGLKNGTVFVQALPYNGKIYFHEMGFRLSGGLIFKMTAPLIGINDMKMMIRYALGGDMCTDEELAKIDVNCGGRAGAQLMIPLNAGVIGMIEGVELAKKHPCVCDFIQYYVEGDLVKEEYIGTLQQLFGRFTMVADSKADLLNAINEIQNQIVIKDKNGRIMNTMLFDFERIK